MTDQRPQEEIDEEAASIQSIQQGRESGQVVEIECDDEGCQNRS